MTKFLKEGNLATRSIGGETIIVPIREGVGDLSAIYTLNEVGTRIWQLVDGRTPVEQIVKTITEEYEVPEEQARKDVTDYLESLEEARLIKGIEGYVIGDEN